MVSTNYHFLILKTVVTDIIFVIKFTKQTIKTKIIFKIIIFIMIKPTSDKKV